MIGNTLKCVWQWAERQGAQRWSALGLAGLACFTSGAGPVWRAPASLESAEASPWIPATSSLYDCRLTVLVQQALLNDEQLTNFNIGVSVHDHVASLWGSLPSQPLVARAVKQAATVPGIADVQNQLHVELPPVPVADRRNSISPSHAVRWPQEVVPPTGELTGLAADAPWQAPRLVGRPARSEDVLPTMPPIQIPTPSQSGNAATQTQPTFGLLERIELLRRANVNLQSVQIEVSGGNVFLRGSAKSREDLFAFAQTVSRLPGVTRVTIGDGLGTGDRR